LLAADQIKIDWAPGTTPFDGAVDGDVVWSTAQQTGYMRFVGMPVNDPTQEQYQLWIIDPARDDEPIDGGVFDIASSGEVIVPIDAKLTVVDPAAFAITIEKPGGVVVSTQERLPLLAPVKG
ncbi:MAG: anti-sigma factor domain-containing protein, partial [Rhodopirellula sp. JB053]